jgi:predicted DNA-binding protein (UPF0251 family)
MKKPYPRHLEALKYMLNYVTKQAVIAENMGISYKTVKNYLDIARKRTGAKNTANLVAIAMTKGWIESKTKLALG